VVAAPTLVAHGSTVLNTSGLTSKTAAIGAVQVGDWVIVKGGSADYGASNPLILGTPTGLTGATFSLKQSSTIASTCGLWMWAAQVATAESPTVSVPATGGTTPEWGFTWQVWRGSSGPGATNKAQVTGGVPTVSLTTTAANSAITAMVGDWAAVNSATWTYAAVNGTTPTQGGVYEDGALRGDGATYAAYSWYYPDAGATGAKTVAMVTPTGQTYSIAALEILPNDGSSNTSTLYASGTPSTTGSTWTTVTNATGAPNAARAVFTNAASGGVGTINCAGYGAQTAIGATPASVNRVDVTVYGYVATVARWTSMTVGLFDGSTQVGTSQTMTLTTTTTNAQAFTFTGVTWANLANLTIRVTGTHSGTTSSTMNVDAVGVVVNYTPASTGQSGSGTGSAVSGATGSAQVLVQGSGTASSTSTATGSAFVLVQGSGTASATSTATGSGTSFAIVSGSGTASATSTATGTGYATKTGSGTAGATSGAIGTSYVLVQGSGTAGATSGAAGASQVVVLGSGTGSAVSSATGAGSVGGTHTGTGSATSTATGSGRVLVQASGAGSMTSGATGTSYVIVRGSGTASATSSATGTGTATSGPQTITGTGAGSATSSATGAAQVTVYGSGAGSATSGATGTSSTLRIGTGAGSATSGAVGDAQLTVMGAGEGAAVTLALGIGLVLALDNRRPMPYRGPAHTRTIGGAPVTVTPGAAHEDAGVVHVLHFDA
jgi:hypothetical protein